MSAGAPRPPWNRELFTGLSAFPLTPLRDDRIDEPAYARIIDRLAASGVDSITALGSTGSYAYFTLDERRLAARIAVEHAGTTPLFVGVGALRTSHVVELARDAERIGAAGLLVAPMSYQPLTVDEVFGLFADLAASVSLPVIVYDNPGTTHFAFTDDLYARIADLPNVASIKIPEVPSAANAARERIRHLRSLLPERVTIGISGDSAAATGLNAGCDIWYSVIGGTMPAHALAITRAALGGDAAAAQVESSRLQPLWDLFDEFGGSFRVVATLAELTGLAGPHSSPRPLRSLSAPDRDRVSRVATGLGLIPGTR